MKSGSANTSPSLGRTISLETQILKKTPDLFIAKALGLTKNIKIGTGVVLLQLHDPDAKMLAHRIAMLDHLAAQGRFYFGVGTGGVPTEFEFFGVEESGATPRPGGRGS